jgi:hypothetical protein
MTEGGVVNLNYIEGSKSNRAIDSGSISKKNL